MAAILEYLHTPWSPVANQVGPFKGEFRWLSNMEPVELTVSGVKSRSVENFYQAMKRPSDKDYYARCISAKDGYVARRLSRTKPPGTGWERQKISVMLSLLLLKFTKNEHFKKKLVFDTDFRPIVEINTCGDTFWGYCESSGGGHNILGKLLMIIRKAARVNCSILDVDVRYLHD